MLNSFSHIKERLPFLIRPISRVYMTGLNGKAVEAAIRNFLVQESIYCTIIICGLLWINEEFQSGIKGTWEGGLMDGHGDEDQSWKTDCFGFLLLQKSGTMGISETPLETTGK